VTNRSPRISATSHERAAFPRRARHMAGRSSNAEP
jgi:hypothetical protein